VLLFVIKAARTGYTQSQVQSHSQMIKEIIALKQNAKRTFVDTLINNALAMPANIALRWWLQSHQQVQQSRLTQPAGADNGHQFARIHSELPVKVLVPNPGRQVVKFKHGRVLVPILPTRAG
jgi:hypothetical protein